MVGVGVPHQGLARAPPGSVAEGFPPVPGFPCADEPAAWLPARLFADPAPVPAAPPLAPAPGCRVSSPPVMTVALTWTSAARTGGTATAIVAIEAAAASPPARRVQVRLSRRMARGAAAARRQAARRRFSSQAAQPS